MMENLRAVEEEILKACQRAGRTKDSVRILLATKTVSVDRLRTVYNLGYHLFGENTAQELSQKFSELSDVNLEWHFIGHLQTNKVKDVVGKCGLIHSVDRLKLAEEISKRAKALNQTQNILMEVNTSGEASKSGVAPEQALELCRQMAQLPNVVIQGLMTIAENSENSAKVRASFKALKQISKEIQSKNISGVSMTELSMGMSQDYQIAIEEGATIVRLGSVVFGQRMTTRL